MSLEKIEARDRGSATALDLEGLNRDLASVPALPWKLATSCSFRRICGPDGKDGGVLSAYNQRSDGHPDLSMPEEQLFALVRLINAYPALLSRLEAAEAALQSAQAELKRTREALTPGADTKAAYIGEFQFPFSARNAQGEAVKWMPNVPWTTIKEIMAAIRAHADLQTPEAGDA